MQSALTILSTKKLKEPILEEAAASGITIRDVNFIKITAIVDPQLATAIENSRHHIVFTSANAVKAFSKNIEQFNLSIPPRYVFCLQGETMNEVSRLLNMAVIAAAKDAATLAALISQQKMLEAISLVCGNTGRNDLPDLLRQQNVAVEEIEIYKTIINTRPITEKYAAILFFNAAAVEAFFQTNILPRNIPCFCAGDATARSVKNFTANTIITCPETNQDSVLRTVAKYFRYQLKNKPNDRNNSKDASGKRQATIKK